MRESALRITLAALALAAGPAAAQDHIGVVKRTFGQVHIEREGVRLVAAPGMDLARGDRIVTGPDAYAHLRMRGVAPLVVSPSADVVVDRFAAPPASAQRNPTGLVQRIASILAFGRQRQ